MSTATDTSVDELYDLFGLTGPEDADPCEAFRRQTGQPCPNEAVFIVRWGPADTEAGSACQCSRTSHLCLRHGERAMAVRRIEGGGFFCRVCDKLMIPIYIDKIQRGAA